MKNYLIIPIIASFTLPVLPKKTCTQPNQQIKLAKVVLSDKKLHTVQARTLRLLTGQFAGTSYGEVWFNSFIKGSLQVLPADTIRKMLLLFFKMQGEDGNIVAGWAADKNTMETDQEPSLIQAVKNMWMLSAAAASFFYAQ
ncbi:hypothetical protein ACDQ55_15745 [Chitinophaga sp. 30R24]|uniref:hypothetical protein n=1 Tax=Chitinophaga sp. 30R24 TaxID=3248838 RepID=UPI003B91BDA7